MEFLKSNQYIQEKVDAKHQSRRKKKLFNASRKPGQVRSKCQFSSADFLTHYEIDVNVNLYQNLSSVTVSNTLAQRSLSSFSNDKYQTSKFKKLADDNLKSCKKKKMVENSLAVGERYLIKKKLLITSNFSLSNMFFQKNLTAHM